MRIALVGPQGDFIAGPIRGAFQEELRRLLEPLRAVLFDRFQRPTEEDRLIVDVQSNPGIGPLSGRSGAAAAGRPRLSRTGFDLLVPFRNGEGEHSWRSVD